MSEQSFSKKIKEEIISKINSSVKADACLYGLVLCANVLSPVNITLLTETGCTRDFFILNAERICGKGTVSETVYERRGETQMKKLSITDALACKKLMDYFHIDKNCVCDESYPRPRYYPQFIAGVFLACGSVSSPEKGYHMEMSLPDLSLCNRLGLILLEKQRMLAKYTERKSRHILYFKESENIIDMIALMGASNASFELMNLKIYKDMRNNINRGMNCVNANIDKAVRAAEKQIEDIELIDERAGIGSLPENLRKIALLRYENPEYNLAELGAALDPPISRSGANHRLKKIAAIADEFRKTDGGN